MAKIKQKAKEDKNNGSISTKKRGKKYGDDQKFDQKFKGNYDDLRGRIFNVGPGVYADNFQSTKGALQLISVRPTRMDLT